MSEEVGVVLISHGNLAKAAMDSVTLILGEQTKCKTLGVYLDDHVEVLEEQLREAVESVYGPKGAVIVTDIIGGTPMNLAGKLAADYELLLCSGLNLPILIELMTNRERTLDQLKRILAEAYQQGFTIRRSIDYCQEVEEDDSVL